MNRFASLYLRFAMENPFKDPSFRPQRPLAPWIGFTFCSRLISLLGIMLLRFPLRLSKVLDRGE